MAASEWYTIENVDELDSPALVVYPARVEHNIDLLKTMTDDISRLRPHVKTHKSGEVTRMMLQAGISKFKCATIAEAEMLGQSQAPDVLLAYQPTLAKLRRLIQLIKTYPQTRFSCLVDNEYTTVQISEEAVSLGIVIPVYIDLNVGMNRTGIVTSKAMELYQKINELKGISIAGLHAYDGHIHDADYALREQKAITAIKPVFDLTASIVAAGYPAPVIIGSSSPTLPILANYQDMECSPGTFVYWDRGYQEAFVEQPFLPAALVIGRVISLPDDGKICIDIGHKAVSSENNISKRIHFLNAPELVFTGHSEEHLVAEAGIGHTYKIGDVLYGLPHHICPTVALYERVKVVEKQFVTSEWMTAARDRQITI
jgi:D-serine deaminase-like pyridoxal phosphate-dependent protein